MDHSTARIPASSTAGAALTWAVGGVLAIAAWLASFAAAPNLGLPPVEPEWVIAPLLSSQAGAGSPPLGRAIMVAGLMVAVLSYAVATSNRRLPAGLASGALYGLILWFVTGAFLMPLIGVLAPAGPDPGAAIRGMTAGAPAEPMPATFMMLHLGPGAPASALVAWVLFGLVLGAAGARARARTAPRR
jgi:hypothetical protein